MPRYFNPHWYVDPPPDLYYRLRQQWAYEPEPSPWHTAAGAAAAAAHPATAMAYRYGGHGPYVDPLPDPWNIWAHMPQFPRGWGPGPAPGDPGPDDVGWRGGGSLGAIPRFRPHGDPPPIDILAHVRVFERYLVDILRAAGLDDARVAKATVADLVDAYKVSLTPPVARADSRAVSASHVASMDRGDLESLKLHLQSETARLQSLAKVVEQRLGEVAK